MSALLCRYESSKTQEMMMKQKDTDMCRLAGVAAADVAVNSGDGRFEMEMEQAMKLSLLEQLLPRQTVQLSRGKQPWHAQVSVSCTLSSTMHMWACMVASLDKKILLRRRKGRSWSCLAVCTNKNTEF